MENSELRGLLARDSAQWEMEIKINGNCLPIH